MKALELAHIKKQKYSHSGNRFSQMLLLSQRAKSGLGVILPHSPKNYEKIAKYLGIESLSFPLSFSQLENISQNGIVFFQIQELEEELQKTHPPLVLKVG